jgi:hypothetical protein
MRKRNNHLLSWGRTREILSDLFNTLNQPNPTRILSSA